MRRRPKHRSPARRRNEPNESEVPYVRLDTSYFTGVLGSEEELGWRLENIVYLELLRRRMETDVEIFYYRDQSYDIDFCLTRHGKVVELVQVAYTIEGAKTRKRELPSLFGAGRKLSCGKLTLITDHERETVKDGELTAGVVMALGVLDDGRGGTGAGGGVSCSRDKL